MTEGEEDVPQLSSESLKALQEFLREQALKDNNSISENWQLSQFWYDEYTSNCLSKTTLSLCEKDSNIALISCPTLYPNIKSLIEETKKKNITIVLFEYDKRFSKYDTDYVFYDYNDPLNINKKYEHLFDVIIVDPPFLSEECLFKIANTIYLLKKSESKIILCTGAVMEESANKLLNLKKCNFQPKHKNNLANEFICLTNFGEIQT